MYQLGERKTEDLKVTGSIVARNPGSWHYFWYFGALFLYFWNFCAQDDKLLMAGPRVKTSWEFNFSSQVFLFVLL